MNKINKLYEMIEESNNIVFFSGAGVSTDSGIKDFRSEDGLYNVKYKYPAEQMLSSDMFYSHTEDFYEFYKDNFNCLEVKPNIIHKYLQKLEDSGKLKAIITQNIDGLHSKAGNKKVYEIHGSIYKNHCLDCNKQYDGEYIFKAKLVPKCSCGGIIKPDVVLFGEQLPVCFNYAIEEITKADMLIVAGTSLTVQPASNLVSLFKGRYLVILNNTKTNYDSKADLVINDSLKNIFEQLEKLSN